MRNDGRTPVMLATRIPDGIRPSPHTETACATSAATELVAASNFAPLLSSHRCVERTCFEGTYTDERVADRAFPRQSLRQRRHHVGDVSLQMRVSRNAVPAREFRGREFIEFLGNKVLHERSKIRDVWTLAHECEFPRVGGGGLRAFRRQCGQVKFPGLPRARRWDIHLWMH